MIKFQSFLSGSSGNCTFITDDKTNLLVDCGAGGQYISECLRRIGVMPETISGILLTHEHTDHIVGAGVMSRKYHIPIFATKKTWTAIGDSIGTVAQENKCMVEPSMQIGTFSVTAFPIPHDAKDPVGYTFQNGSNKFSIATDMGEINESILTHLSGSESVIVEANHDEEMLKNGRYPYPLKKRILGNRGHLSNEACGQLCKRLAQTGTRSFWLGHLSPENNRPSLAYEVVLSALNSVASELNISLSLNVLPRYWIQNR